MINRIIILCSFCFSFLASIAYGQQKVAIVQFIEVSALTKNKDAIIKVLDKNGIDYDYYNSQGQISIARQIASKVFGDDYDAIVTITTPVTQVFKSVRKDNKPIIFSAVTDPYGAKIIGSDSYLQNDRIVGAGDEPPIEKTFTLVQEIFNPKKVGIIYNPSEQNSVIMVESLKSKFAGKFEFYESVVNSSTMAKDAANKFIGKVDIVYAPLDSTILSTMEIISKVLLKNNIPLITSDPDTIEKGATMAVGFSQSDIGHEAGLKVVEVLEAANDKSKEEKIIISKIPNYTIKFNKENMKLFNIKIPEIYNK
jgi:putative ABC transport system substrate-binding protein